MDLVPFSPVWLITTALEMFLVVWWLRSPVGRVWIHFLMGLLSKRHYWAPPWKHRWADDLSRPPLPFSSENRRRLFISLIGATLLAIPAWYALLGDEAAGGMAALLFLLTQAPVCLATALVLDRATPESTVRPWNRLRGWRMGSVEPPRFRLADDRPNAIRFTEPSLKTPHGGGDLKLWIRVTNPNAFGIELERLETRLCPGRGLDRRGDVRAPDVRAHGNRVRGAAGEVTFPRSRGYHAALAMLRQAIEQCPDEVWFSDGHRNSYWPGHRGVVRMRHPATAEPACATRVSRQGKSCKRSVCVYC